MTIAIRPCTPADAALLTLIAQQTFVEAWGGILPPAHVAAHVLRKLNVETHAAWLTAPEGRLWFATENNFPIGYAGLASPDLPSIETHAGDIELKRIYVMQHVQGNPGAGAALLAAALTEARAMGKARVLLGVKDDNHRAIAFYKKHGFTQIGTRQFQVGDGLYNDVVMALAL